MASIMDMLLAADPRKLKERPTARMKMKRLEKLLGGDCEFEIEALTASELDELRSVPKEHMIVRAVTNVDFGDAQLCSVLRPEGRNTPLLPTETVEKLLLPGEIDQLYTAILKLSGYGDDAVEKIEKN